jgi:hypothetical protein
MGRPNTVESHPLYDRIIDELSAGTSSLKLAKRFALSRQALDRYRREHLARVIATREAAKQAEAAAVEHRQPIVQPFHTLPREDQIRVLMGKTIQLLHICERGTDIRAALACLAQLTKLLEADDGRKAKEPDGRGPSGGSCVVILPDNGRSNTVD